jgi:hypothetical protein
MTFRNKLVFCLLAPHPTQAGGPPLVIWPQLLIQYICSYPPLLEAVPSSAAQVHTMLWWQGTPSYMAPLRNSIKITEFETLAAAVMKSSIFWDIMLSSLLKVRWYFGRTLHLHLEHQTMNQTRNQCEANCKHSFACSSDKLTFHEPHGIYPRSWNSSGLILPSIFVYDELICMISRNKDLNCKSKIKIS